MRKLSAGKECLFYNYRHKVKTTDKSIKLFQVRILNHNQNIFIRISQFVFVYYLYAVVIDIILYFL